MARTCEKEIVLLGAGASVNAGIPSSRHITKEIADAISYGKEGEVLALVIGGLLFQRGVRGLDPFDGVDVEDVFNAVQLLAERDTLEAAPFVSAWHSRIDDLDRADSWDFPSANGGELGRAIADYVSKFVDDALSARHTLSTPIQVSHRTFNKDLDELLVRIIEKRRPQRGSGNGIVFLRTCGMMINTLADIVWLQQHEKVSYLAPLLSLVDSQGSLTVATLNYDNSVELVSQQYGVECHTGIDEWSHSHAFAFPPHGLSLIKLHGSIDWAFEPCDNAQGLMPHTTITRRRADEVGAYRYSPAILFGGRNKLTAEGPFLDLLCAFRDALSECVRLTVIGYSFRDDHINEFISQWLNGSKDRRLRVVDPAFLENKEKYAEQLRDYCGNRLDVVSKTAEQAIPELYTSR